MVVNVICETEKCVSQNQVYVLEIELESLEYYKAYCGGCEQEITNIEIASDGL
jgi:hypothetical protein